MTEMLAPITLPQAKPYEGKAQTAAVGAAVRRMIEAGWAIAPSRWPDGKAQVQVRGRGYLSVDGEMVSVATVNFLPGKGATYGQVCAALREAGWHVTEHNPDFVRDGSWLSAEVAGPGVAEWAAEWKAAKAAHAERKAADDTARVAKADRLKALLAEHDIAALVGHVSDHADSVSVPYGRMIELIEKLSARP